MKRLAISTAIVLATLAFVYVLVSYPEAIVLFLATLAIAATTRPLVESFVQRGVPRGLSVVLTYVTIIGFLAVLLFGISGRVFTDLQHLGDSFVVFYDSIWKTWPTGTQMEQTIIRQLPPPQALYDSITGKQGQVLAQTLLGITSSSFATISQIAGLLVLSIYWTIDRIHFERLWLSLLPVEIRARWREIGRDVETDLGAYIRSEVVQSLIAGGVLNLGFYLIGLPYPTLLALLCALAWLIPWLGGPLATVMVFLDGVFFTGNGGFFNGWPLGLGGAIMTAAVLSLLEIFLEPRLFHRRQYSPWLAVLFILALGDALGLAGVIIAPPLAAVAQMVGRRVVQESAPVFATNEDLESARRIADLDDRVSAVKEMVEVMEEKPSPQTTSMLTRLANLIGEANQVIAEQKEQ